MIDRKISKFLSLILRHKPEKLGITLDKNGWASIQEIIEKMNRNGKQIDMDLIRHIVATNNKKRFKLSDDETMIRANQGHSIQVELDLQKKTPPPTLFHGTATRFYDSIKEKGLIKGSRLYVHLSGDKDTAIKVGKRHGKVVVLNIKAQEMHEKGFDFFLSENGVWLTDHVPVEYIF